MPSPAGLPDELVVSLIIAKQESQQQSPPTGQPPWWTGLTLDEQDDLLDRIDPEQYGPGQRPPMATGRWNREKRRVRRARERWIEEIRSLRRACKCGNCVRHRRPPFPKYYVASTISYECWLEEQTVDPEMQEELDVLRNNRRRVGSVFLHRLSGRAG
jgi:hypothetical protein